MTNASTLRASHDRALTARRRSFAQGAAEGITREGLAREHGLTPSQVQHHLTDPDVALLAWIWHAFAMVEARGSAAVLAWLHEHLLLAIRGRRGLGIGLGRLLFVLFGLTFLSFSTIGRDLLAAMVRKSIPCQRGSSPFLWLCRHLAHELASIVETVAITRLRRERPAEVGAYCRAFVLIVRAGGEPFRELVLGEPPLGGPDAHRWDAFARARLRLRGGAFTSDPLGVSVVGSLPRVKTGVSSWSAVPPWLGPPWPAYEPRRA